MACFDAEKCAKTHIRAFKMLKNFRGYPGPSEGAEGKRRRRKGRERRGREDECSV
jgi:hypothetical protein